MQGVAEVPIVILPDVNVLVYAFREAAPRHVEYRDWLRPRIAGREAFGLSGLVLSGVVRVLTHLEFSRH